MKISFNTSHTTTLIQANPKQHFPKTLNLFFYLSTKIPQIFPGGTF